MIHSKYVVAALIIVVAIGGFSTGTSFASSSALKYQQYKNSETYKMLHGKKSKDTESNQGRDTKNSPGKGGNTNDYQYGHSDSSQHENNTNDIEPHIKDQDWKPYSSQKPSMYQIDP